ncbi:TniQ family protein [Pseudomonas sichuanensis]|uniref:TniQ family protein n=1 Tax=Pseudomonas sichuanensis TaxID=2213015 RepID=UPI002ABA81DD|nr:TniQ family protein [Pseudomonas sichuanensis]MDZ4019263.1 hypothetical protein [Pseudomonas sichuanensis]
MLPLHTQPRQDEVFSSWLVRLALENEIPVHTFYYSLLQYHGQIWTRDIDRHPPHELLDLIAQATGQKANALARLCLTSYEGRLYEKLPITGDAPWLMPAGIYHRIRKRPGMQFCPVCLSSDNFPYYRKLWRTSLAAMCDIHHCRLLEYCPSCQAPVAFHQHGMGRLKNLRSDAGRICHNCRYDFADCVIAVADVDTEILEGYAELLTTIKSDHLYYLDLTDGNEFLLFKGIRALVGGLGGRNGFRLRSVLSALLQIPLVPEVGKDFEYQSVQFRMYLMLCVVWLLKGWPERFCEVCAEANFTRSRFSEIYNELPFWISSVVDVRLNLGSTHHSYEEIDSAIKYLSMREGSICWQSLGMLMGLKRDSAKSALNLWLRRGGRG